ncbi:MAG: diguanylate cyclase [Gammaproteobacteria bacterium]
MSQEIKKPSKGAEQILLAQIKQEFTAPADAIEQYIDLIAQYAEENKINLNDEITQIRSGQEKLLTQYEEAFRENTKNDAQRNKTAQEYSELRHNLRTPLNAIIGYSEILMEDFEDDLSESCIEDLNNILSLSRDTEKAIEKFVDFIKGDLKSEPSDNSGTSSIKNAESLFKSLGDLDYSLEIDDNLKDADILIVDDNVTNCEVLQRRLGQHGLDCRVVYNGTDAITEVNRQTPDLILLDVILPDINGLELLKEFRLNHSADELPIIMVSAFNDVDSTAKCIKLGATDYLPKPLNGTILMAKAVASLEAKYFREANRKLLEELHIRATTCPLTGIYNRKVVFDHGQEFFEKAKKETEKHFSLLSIDIDFFKKVNDTYGHPGGDVVIIALANLLKDKSEPNIVGRVGGEEYMALIMDNESETIEEFCSSLRKEVNNLKIPFQDIEININISGGVTHSSTSSSFEDMINVADERLYKSKENGRDQITFD